MKEALIRMPHARITWICAMFLLGYVGTEVALGGWIVKFMLEVRKGGDFASGMVATGYWMGITVGRVILGFVTPRLGEKLAIIVSSLALATSRMLTAPDLSCPHHGARAHLLARAAVLRFGRRRVLPRVSHGPVVSSRHRRGDEASSQAPARQRDWIRGRIWRLRRCNFPVRCRSDRAGEGGEGVAADCAGSLGRHPGAVDLLTADSEEDGVNCAAKGCRRDKCKNGCRTKVKTVLRCFCHVFGKPIVLPSSDHWR